MKRTIAAILLLIIVFSAGVVPSNNASASSDASGEIYSKSSTGSMVVRIQTRLRELGYLNFKPTGSYKSMTVDAVKAFQKNYRDSGYEMQVDGRMGEQSLDLLFKYEAMRASLSGISIPAGPNHGSSTMKATGELVPWSTVKDLLRPNTEYKFIDCYTGNTFRLVFVEGENHAEMESASINETSNFLLICGKEVNFLKRPVVVEIDGRKIAASVQCWPHGQDYISGNAMHGHVCVYFDGSLSSVGNLPDVEHNENIHKAMGQ